MTDDIDKTLSKKYCARFGMIAVDLKIITSEQLKEALSEQIDDDISNRPHRVIGRILFEKGWISLEQIEIVLDNLFKRIKENS